MQIAQVSKAQNRICLVTEMNGWPYSIFQVNWHLAFQKGRPDERLATDGRIGRALMEHGGFVISNYPDATKIDERALKMLSFFELSEAEKRAVASKATDPDGKMVYRG